MINSEARSLVISGMGNSMMPLIQDQFKVEITDFDNLRVGEIVALKIKNSIVVHRIMYFVGDKVRTKGDFNLVFDEPVEKKAIIGKVKSVQLPVGIIDLENFFVKILGSILYLFSITRYIWGKLV